MSTTSSTTNTSRSGSKQTAADPPNPPRPNRHFDIDHYLNRFVPRPRLYLLPPFLSRWLGYRTAEQPQHLLNTSLTTLYSFLGAFIAIGLTILLFEVLPPSKASGLTNPAILGSLGATSILTFSAPASPLAQPRSLLVSQAISATVGIVIAMLFNTLPLDRALQLRPLSGALAVAISAALMVFTKTVHPPAGATALLAVTSEEVRHIRWWLIIWIELGSLITMLVGLVLLNIHSQRRYPVFWWTEHSLQPEVTESDEEEADPDVFEKVESHRDFEEDVSTLGVVVPPGTELTEEETVVLEHLRRRLYRARAEHSEAHHSHHHV
jgi:CBS-domain-containing membrane protein